MKTENGSIFVDWITVSQEHEKPHKPYCGEKWVNSETGEIRFTHKSCKGENGSNVQIKSDGRRVTFSGNVSRWNRTENVFGLTLDQTKEAVNEILISEGLPPFNDGKKTRLSDGTKVDSGAVISRLDMTANIETGSATNKRHLLCHVQGQEMTRLEKMLIGLNTYFGKDSESRTFRIYDKAKHLQDVVMPKAEKHRKGYIEKLIQYCQTKGIVRVEIECRRYLRNNALRNWRNAEQKTMIKEFAKATENLNMDIENPDLDDLTKEEIKTLALYLSNFPVREILSRNTFFKHKKVLKKKGFDISDQNVERIKTHHKKIQISIATMPDWYRPPITAEDIEADRRQQKLRLIKGSV